MSYRRRTLSLEVQTGYLTIRRPQPVGWRIGEEIAGTLSVSIGRRERGIVRSERVERGGERHKEREMVRNGEIG